MFKIFDYSTSLLFFWVKLHIAISDSEVDVKRSKIFLGFIPLMKSDSKFKLDTISDVKIRSRVRPLPVILGLIVVAAILASLALYVFFDYLWTILIAVVLVPVYIGILGAITQRQISFTSSGEDFLFAAPFFETAIMDDVNAAINQGLIREKNREYVKNTPDDENDYE